MPRPRLLLLPLLLVPVACSDVGKPLDRAAVLSDPQNMGDVTRVVRETFPEVPQLSTSDLARKLDSATPPLVLDVRDEKEFAVSHLPNARRIDPKSDPVAQLAALDVPKDREIVLYCSVGYRSSKAADALRKAGYTRTANLEGSIFQWANEGRPVARTTDKGEILTPTVHPYNAKWGRLLDPARRAPAD